MTTTIWPNELSFVLILLEIGHLRILVSVSRKCSAILWIYVHPCKRAGLILLTDRRHYSHTFFQIIDLQFGLSYISIGTPLPFCWLKTAKKMVFTAFFSFNWYKFKFCHDSLFCIFVGICMECRLKNEWINGFFLVNSDIELKIFLKISWTMRPHSLDKILRYKQSLAFYKGRNKCFKV